MITNLKIGHNGRLGNQIFQYAILKVISKINGYEVVLPEENTKTYVNGRFNYSTKKNDVYKLDLLECFDIKERLLPKEEIKKQIKVAYNEHFSMEYDDALLKAPDNCDINGYFICTKYFNDHKEYLKENLIIKNEITNYTNNVIENIKNKNIKNITTVHVRRGDNVLDAGRFYTLLTKNYYNSLFDKLRREDNLFVIVSDDINWCKENLNNKDVFFYDDISRTKISKDSLMDFSMLYSGDSIIMSNSTFSWWASWLSPAKDVYCPSKWLGPDYENVINETFFKDNSWNLCSIV